MHGFNQCTFTRSPRAPKQSMIGRVARRETLRIEQKPSFLSVNALQKVERHAPWLSDRHNPVLAPLPHKYLYQIARWHLNRGRGQSL
jgi:hypothetical protein